MCVYNYKKKPIKNRLPSEIVVNVAVNKSRPLLEKNYPIVVRPDFLGSYLLSAHAEYIREIISNVRPTAIPTDFVRIIVKYYVYSGGKNNFTDCGVVAYSRT